MIKGSGCKGGNMCFSQGYRRTAEGPRGQDTGLIEQKNKSLDEQARLFALLGTLPKKEVEEEENGDEEPEE